MPALHKNRVKMTVTSAPGTSSPVTLVAASTGHQSFATAYGANATVDVLISNGTDWEVQRGVTYTHSGTTVSRGTPEASSNSGSLVNFSSATNLTVEEILTAGVGNSFTDFVGAWGALAEENAITGAATAVFGKLNVCTGTSADYEVALPAVSGNGGKYLGIRMDAALTKLVTLNADGTETIDGSLTRVMWAKETALLYCNGTTWTKVAGKTVPMTAKLKRTTALSSNFVDSTLTKITLNTSVTDLPAGQVDTGNNRISIKRPGSYVVNSGIQYDSAAPDPGSTTKLTCAINLNGITASETISETVLVSGNYVEPQASTTVTLSAGDLLYLCGQVNASSAANIITGKDVNFLSSAEIPSW